MKHSCFAKIVVITRYSTVLKTEINMFFSLRLAYLFVTMNCLLIVCCSS
jgi:hypothetical protein